MPELTIGPPGVPDQGTFVDDELPADVPELAGGAPAAISLPTVIGLVRSAAAIIAQVLAAQYPERPGIGAMTDDEATGIATALVSWSARNPGLRSALERSDALAVAFYLSGWAGRTATDIIAVRKDRNERSGQAQVHQPGAPPGGLPGAGGNDAGSHAGGPHPAGGGLA